VSDLLLVMAIGCVGFLLRRYGFPLAPVMIGVVLGPLAETSLRNALMSSGGRVGTFVGSPITWSPYGLLALVLAHTAVRKLRAAQRQDV
jgi:putative tricarboxylic transport membrane protein